MIVVSAGNVDDPQSWRRYFAENLTNEVHDPGQAWNVLTVGAYTEKVTISDPTLTSYSPVAPHGGLSPYSPTSTTWPSRKWPIKPEVLFEGGNVARGPNESIFDPEDLKLLRPTTTRPMPSSHRSVQRALRRPRHHGWLRGFRHYISMSRPETVPRPDRPQLRMDGRHEATVSPDQSKTSYPRLLRVCGYGVPDLERALSSAANSLTLISQAELQPFDAHDGRFVTRDMHLYRVPWPSQALIDLGETQVEMRITLSYFVEPGPGEVGWQDRYRYPSYALRFEVNGPGESEGLCCTSESAGS